MFFPAVIIAYINFILMLGMVVFIFKVPMRGSLPLLLVLAFFFPWMNSLITNYAHQILIGISGG